MAQPDGIPHQKNIIRIDTKKVKGRSSGGTHGWQVKFQLNEQEISKFFSDKKYGGVEAALDEAITFRDSFLVDIHAAKANKRENNDIQVGDRIPGVMLIKGRKKATSDEYSSYWHAQWTTLDGKREYKNFFIARYGYDKARELAIQARLEAAGKKVNPISPLITPSDSKIKLWRYLDFTKFVSMLDKNALFFVFAEFLNDPFEGATSKINKALRPSIFEKKFFETNLNRAKLRSRVAINSWHMNTHESAAMWLLYAQTKEAVCIQTTYANLRSTLPQLFKIYQMTYVDYNSNYIPEYHPLTPFVFKRKSFEHEQELRALLDMEEADSDLHGFLGIETSQYGIYKAISLKDLIQTVYVAPESPDWFYELVKSVCKTYGLEEIPVVRSSLETEPFY